MTHEFSPLRLSLAARLSAIHVLFMISAHADERFARIPAFRLDDLGVVFRGAAMLSGAFLTLLHDIADMLPHDTSAIIDAAAILMLASPAEPFPCHTAILRHEKCTMRASTYCISTCRAIS